MVTKTQLPEKQSAAYFKKLMEYYISWGQRWWIGKIYHQLSKCSWIIFTQRIVNIILYIWFKYKKEELVEICFKGRNVNKLKKQINEQKKKSRFKRLNSLISL